ARLDCPRAAFHASRPAVAPRARPGARGVLLGRVPVRAVLVVGASALAGGPALARRLAGGGVAGPGRRRRGPARAVAVPPRLPSARPPAPRARPARLRGGACGRGARRGAGAGAADRGATGARLGLGAGRPGM
ncbi:MAG: hypothetical protein AVDCRST_MAG04-504, partial [uncultured Acetobacteraceae bacterium]